MGIKVKVAGAWQDVYQNADELPLGTILMWHKSLEARGGTARETGTATTNTADKLIDSTATFVTNSVAAGDIVYNSTDSVYATVVTVDSETQLTLDWDACPDGNEAYSVYPEPDVQPGWVEMDGSTISDADSPFNGFTIEDVVGSERFFRARQTAGRLQADAFQGHDWYIFSNSVGTSYLRGNLDNTPDADYTSGYSYSMRGTGTTAASAGKTNGGVTSDGTNGTPRTDDETRPINLSIVPIVKIKESADVKLATYYSVAGDNFTTLTALTSLEDADEFVVYDDSASVYKKTTVGTLRELTPPTMIVEHQETSGTSGGSATAGSWQTRTLNTTVLNEITGASLSSNQITLPVGTYEVEFVVPGMQCNRHQARFYDVTGSAVLFLGTSEFSDSSASEAQTISTGYGRFTLSVSSAVRIEHRVNTGGSGINWGVAGSFGTELYSRVVIKKVS